MPNLSNILAPLYQLVRKGAKWKWNEKQSKAFEEAKRQLISTRVLAHYDPVKHLVLACDASPYGLGSVLSHKMEAESKRQLQSPHAHKMTQREIE